MGWHSMGQPITKGGDSSYGEHSGNQGADEDISRCCALNNLSLSVRRGECHAIVGENGAGKSTLIKSVAGAITPDSGTITFEGTEYTSLDPTLSKKIGIGVIYQEFVLCPALTIAENIFLGERLTSGVFQNEALMNQKAQEILDRFKVEGLKATALVRDLSTAYQQLVENCKSNCQEI